MQSWHFCVDNVANNDVLYDYSAFTVGLPGVPLQTTSITIIES